MIRITILCLISFLISCEKDLSPTNPVDSGMGSIKIFIKEKTDLTNNYTDPLSSTPKTANPKSINLLEVRVLKSDNSLVTSKTFTPSGGFFEGTIKVKAQDNLKVLCIGTNNGVVEHFGVDEDVDVKVGKTTTATIPSSQWYSSYIPIITDISPNPSTDGSYTVTWNTVHTATNYVLQEADNQSFSDGYTVYSGTETLKSFSKKTAGTYYYRIMVSNASNITSGWSSGEYVVVNLPLEEFAISGTITGADGVTITLSGDTSDSQVVNDGGSYSFTVTEGGNYTVTPSKPGYTFIPTSQTFNNVISDKTQNFTATQKTHTISGIVSGADGVTVTLGGDASDSQVVNDGGSYSFTVAEGGNYSITPSKPDYTFNPGNQIFNNLSADVTQNFTAVYSPNTHTISGTVSGADGVTITLSGDASGILSVNDGGSYSFIVTEGGNYTVTPSKSGYTFTPESQTFNNVTTDVTQNFIATYSLNTHTISGAVSGADGVTLTLSGDTSDSRVVNDGGSYSFTVAEGGNYTVTPSKSGYTFTPSSKSFTNVTSNQTQNFTTTIITYTISGTVTGADGVTITLSGDATGSQVVNDGNTYSFTVAANGNYTVTPTRSGYTFMPASKTFTNVTANQTQNFTVPQKTHTISGTITSASGVTVTLSGGASDSQFVMNDGGSYSFTVEQGGDYTVTPSKEGFTFFPETKSFNNVTSDISQDFMASSYMVEDYFSDNKNNWYEYESEEKFVAVENGKYVIEVKLFIAHLSWQRNVIDTTKDFQIESSMLHVSGITNNGYGLSLGELDNNFENQYSFTINADGYYTIFKRINNNIVNIINWTYSSYINQGNKTNKLSVTKSGDNLLFYINDMMVNQISSEFLFGDDVGFEVDNAQRIEIDYIIIRQNLIAAKQSIIPQDLQLYTPNFNEGGHGSAKPIVNTPEH